MAADLDPRRHAFRKDIAAASLMGRVETARFVKPSEMQVSVPVLDLLAEPDAGSLASQLLCGEVFDVYDQTAGWAWGQNRADGYVGYVDKSGLEKFVEGGQLITARLAQVYPRPNFKSVPKLVLAGGSRIQVVGHEGNFVETPAGFVSARHLDERTQDFVGEAARFLGVPYLWGGRSSFGLDCSALVQLALLATGCDCPRDSDMQLAELGHEVSGPYRRGDILFWKGHVAIAFDEKTLLHANVHHMSVAFEPIVEALERIAQSDGPFLAHKRL